MSYAVLLAADRPLPELSCDLPEPQVFRTDGYVIQLPSFFAVRPADFDPRQGGCRCAKDIFHALELEGAPALLLPVLRDYLETNLSPGEAVELWGVWEGLRPGPDGRLAFAEDYARANRSPLRWARLLDCLEPKDLELLLHSRPERSVCLTVRR